MPRQKGDGKGRNGGGRQKGTPNKEKPLKARLREHSLAYFTPSIEEKDKKGRPTGQLVSQFDLDMAALDPDGRVDAEIKLLKFHTPQMQSTSVDVTVADQNQTLSERLARLAAGEDIAAPDEQ